MSAEEKKKVIDNIEATMQIENQKLSKSDKKLLEDYADNKISLDEALDIVKKYILKRA